MALQNIGGSTEKSGISRLTTEYIYWNITSEADLGSASAQVAFTTEGKPAGGDWNSAEIVSTPGASEQNSVRILVGPDYDGVDLDPTTTEPQTYDVWVKIDTGSEAIVRRAGTLKVR